MKTGELCTIHEGQVYSIEGCPGCMFDRASGVVERMERAEAKVVELWEELMDLRQDHVTLEKLAKELEDRHVAHRDVCVCPDD